MLHKLKKKDFAVLRGPLESYRQSPDSLAGALILMVFLQALLYYVTYHISAETTRFPNAGKMQEIHFWFTVSLILLCIIYSIPKIYMWGQKMQYFISILTVQNTGASMYFSALFLIGDQDAIAISSMLTFTKVTLIIAVLLFIATCIRFNILLAKGHYRNGSRKGQLREGFETTSYVPLAIIGSTGFVFVIQFLIGIIDWQNFEDLFIVILCMGLFYVMIFVLPEQLVILYCKFRFKNFNFDKNGVLRRK